MSTRPEEQVDYWRAYFDSLNKSPLGLAVWREIFEDTQLGEFVTRPGESIEEGAQRHQRKLRAIREALEGTSAADLQADLQAVAQSVRQLLQRED